MIYQLIAIIILICFFSIYIGKMIRQKKRGIITDQIAKGNKEKNLLVLETIMKIATGSIVIVEVASIIINTATRYNIVRILGLCCGIIGVLVFGCAVYTMKDSWRAGIPAHDKTTIITDGIYKFSRNPAFLGFYLVYISILCMFFNYTLLIFTIFSITMLHLQILQEEKYLKAVFGDNYIAYKSKVGRYFWKI